MGFLDKLTDPLKNRKKYGIFGVSKKFLDPLGIGINAGAKERKAAKKAAKAARDEQLALARASREAETNAAVATNSRIAQGRATARPGAFRAGSSQPANPALGVSSRLTAGNAGPSGGAPGSARTPALDDILQRIRAGMVLGGR